MNRRFAPLALLFALAAAPGAAQQTGSPTADQQRREALAQLKRVQGTVDGEVAGLDGVVVKNIVQAGDGRLTAVLRQGDALIRVLETMHRSAKSIVAKAPPNPAPFHDICRTLADASCDGAPSSGEKKDGLLTVLKAEDARLREALKRMKAERKGEPRPASDACDAALEADSSTRLASKAATRLALTAFALNQELAGGELDQALDKAAGQNVGKGKAASETKRLLRRTQAASKTRHKAFLRALTGKEKATKNDMALLGAAQKRSEESVRTYGGISDAMRKFTSGQAENAGGTAAGAAGLSLEVSLAMEDVRRLVTDIEAMTKAKKTFLVSGSTDPQAPESRGVFPSLKSAEAAVSRSCGIRKAVASAIQSLEAPPTQAPAAGPGR